MDLTLQPSDLEPPDLEPTVDELAAEVGESGPVTIAGLGTRGGPVDQDAVPGVRTVMAPVGIVDVKPEEMTIRCGAGTPVEALDAALAVYGQTVAIPPTGTVGGALAVGHSGIRRLGYGPVRDTLLQVRYVNAAGQIVKAGGPTVKNVSGFDLCRLMVGSRGTLGFLAEVILRTRPRSPFEQWYTGRMDPAEALVRLYRPTSLLWDGARVWALLEGDPGDVVEQAERADLEPADDPPELPTGGRWSVPPSALPRLAGSGRFVAELGVGVVHHERPAPERPVDPAVRELHRRIKHEFDPDGRLNPGVRVL